MLAGNLASAIQIALIPPDEQGRQEYPKMLYRGGWDAEQTLIVDSCEEEIEAVAQGWSRTPAPRPKGFPINYVEVDPAKGIMYRRCLVRNPQEEKMFHEVTNASDWARDDKYELAGYPVSLDVLVEEHKARLKSMIDQDLLEVETIAVPDAGRGIRNR